MKYTAEEVRARLGFVISDHEPRILTWESGGCRQTSMAECALWDALAERIKADERAVPHVTERLVKVAENARIFVLNDAPKRPRIGEQELRHIAMRSALLAVWPNRPAQAAQVGPATKPHTLADFINAPDAEQVRIWNKWPQGWTR